MVSKKHSHWPIDNESHHHIHVCNILLQVRIGQVQFCTSEKENSVKVILTDSVQTNMAPYRHKHILVNVVFLGVDMDYSIHHLATIFCVCRHILRVLIVIGVCL